MTLFEYFFVEIIFVWSYNKWWKEKITFTTISKKHFIALSVILAVNMTVICIVCSFFSIQSSVLLLTFFFPGSWKRNTASWEREKREPPLQVINMISVLQFRHRVKCLLLQTPNNLSSRPRGALCSRKMPLKFPFFSLQNDITHWGMLSSIAESAQVHSG